eukprot:m.84210 g.84210  ORF g.84210 m.84210 type:complete len:353 (+) comp21180_c0_seq1:282-1340(+)
MLLYVVGFVTASTLFLDLLLGASIKVLLQLHANRLAQVDGGKVGSTGNPWVLEDLVGIVALDGVNLKHVGDEVLGILRHFRPVAVIKFKLALHNHLKQNGIRLVIEGRVTAQQNVQDDTQGPDVNLLTITALHENLRSDIVGGTTGSLEGGLVIDNLGQTKVSNANIGILVFAAEQQVLGLEITVNNAMFVQVLDGFSHLAGETRGISFGKVALINNAVKQFTALNVVKNKVQLVGSIKFFQHANDVRVAHLLQNGNFGLNHVFLSSTESLVDDLQSVLLLVVVAGGELDNSKVARTKFLANSVGLLDITLSVTGEVFSNRSDHLFHEPGGRRLVSELVDLGSGARVNHYVW